jgi:HTH-type transcriptional regulator / antitoxin MqsA
VKGLSGWCEADGEIVFDAESARRYAAAGDELVLREREMQRLAIRRIRRKLRLSQVGDA